MKGKQERSASFNHLFLNKQSIVFHQKKEKAEKATKSVH